MKQKNAFAFENFDEKRIFQRRFFKDFPFKGEQTDAEILETLSPADGDTVATLEKKHETLTKTGKRLACFQSLIARHADGRLEKYRRTIKRKITAQPSEIDALMIKYDREQRLVTNYILVASLAVRELLDKVREKWIVSEEEIQKRYRATFAERLKKAREAAGLKRKDLGELVNISENGYGLYETGKREPSLMSLIRLSRALKVDISWLVGATP